MNDYIDNLVRSNKLVNDAARRAGETIELSEFDESKHPREHGKFASASDASKAADEATDKANGHDEYADLRLNRDMERAARSSSQAMSAAKGGKSAARQHLAAAKYHDSVANTNDEIMKREGSGAHSIARSKLHRAAAEAHRVAAMHYGMN